MKGSICGRGPTHLVLQQRAAELAKRLLHLLLCLSELRSQLEITRQRQHFGYRQQQSHCTMTGLLVRAASGALSVLLVRVLFLPE